MAVRENIERLTQQYKEEEVEYTTYPEDAIKLLEEEEATETEKPKEEVTDKVQSLSAGTQLKGTEKDNY